MSQRVETFFLHSINAAACAECADEDPPGRVKESTDSFFFRPMSLETSKKSQPNGEGEGLARESRKFLFWPPSLFRPSSSADSSKTHLALPRPTWYFHNSEPSASSPNAAKSYNPFWPDDDEIEKKKNMQQQFQRSFSQINRTRTDRTLR